MSSCSNHYGSKCNFSCAVGYQINGSSIVTCVAPGNRPPGSWDNPLPSCEGICVQYLTHAISCDVMLYRIICFHVMFKKRARNGFKSIPGKACVNRVHNNYAFVNVEN